ncbi:SusC/RagA family TonB-linked outer membrane protein [Sphingobacterium sp.]|uniref:SusC/RagA family TonB-linked outer membrane protein n=1 Tax=Sphingobacterium sp. TaxID=341027 RepID=UPI0031DBF30C
MKVSAASFSQRFTIDYRQISLKETLKEIRKKSSYDILYGQRIISGTKPVNISLSNWTIEAMHIALSKQHLAYTIDEKMITADQVKKILLDNRVNFMKSITVKGRVVNEVGAPLVGATISIKGSKQSVLTDASGSFLIGNVEEKSVLLISYVGYETREVKAASDLGNIKLELVSGKLDDVVVTGIVERKRGSFTGSAATISGEQLKSVGNQNVIQALRSLDPSFIVVDNNLKGSDPNALARIELRGKTSITMNTNAGTLTDQFAIDPNMPLFILDGFESTLRQITDMDINRIASITILKDAASTALYGARSANGVVVVETIKPKAGELRTTYTGTFSVNVPSLSDYNLMNSEEKLEFERLSGRYTSNGTGNEDFVKLEEFYNRRLKSVREGVDTYWLNEPLRATAFDQNHSVYANGGSNEFQFGVGMNAQTITGIMKGSDRNNWGARADLTYRKGKLNVTNRIFISGTRADESPYGSFTTYAKINPYYKKEIAGKYVEKIPAGYDGRDFANVANPLYNAQLNSERYSKSLTLQNNFGFNYDASRSIRISGAFQLAKKISTAINFISPLNTQFDNTALLEKGSYSNGRTEDFNFSGNLGLIYNKIIEEKHVLTGNARAEVHEVNSNFIELTAVGFPTGVKGNPNFAYSYLPNSKPQISTPPKKRRINALASINYVYNSRYFLDATYRIDGSTAFGTTNKYTPFWAAGLGWSLHNEEFIKKVNWINSLILRGNIGSTGNQSFGSFASATVYNLETNSNYFGQGLYHTGLGNPDLKWQKTLQTSLGLDMGLMNNRLIANFNAYKKLTSPLIVTVDVPGSNGISSYPMNAGNMTVKGLETNIKFSPIFNINKRIIWTLGVTGSMYTSRYAGLGNVLNGLNAEQQRSNSIQRFTDGKSPDDIWAVQSLGIDPGTGLEVFKKINGDYTFDYDPADIKVIANSRPKVEGVLSSSLRLKAFTFNIYIRYSLGASRMNNALYEKVENISFADLSNNQDKRALDMRWKQAGDIAQFKGISVTDYTPISSRFVQNENIITFESISAGYELQSITTPWLKAARLQNLKFSANMNNIFRLSNIVSERGIDYPFANTISFSINASF